MVQIRTFLAYVVLSGLLAFTPTKIWGKSPFDASKRSTLSFWEYQQKRVKTTVCSNLRVKQ